MYAQVTLGHSTTGLIEVCHFRFFYQKDQIFTKILQTDIV
ncbi:MAG: hypothetical protein ACI85E_002043, partial [Marinomonas primoryensis]